MEKRIYLFEKIPVDVLDLNSIPLEIVKLTEKRGKPRTVFYLNSICANLALSDGQYLKIIKKADLVYADGWGIVSAAKLMGKNLPERVNAADFFDQFCQEVVKQNLSLYLLGARRKIIQKTIANLKQKFPKLKIAGFHHGFFSQEQKGKIIDKINSLKPDLLLVGIGVPKQEKWIYQHKKDLQVKVIWAVGGLFNLLSGELSRAPRLMRNFGLEWVYRLCQEPKRLGRRYFFGLPLFFFQVIKWRLSPVFRKLNLLSSSIINFILLFFVYFVGFGLVSIIGKLLKKSFLGVYKGKEKTYWIKVKEEKKSLKDYYRQF